MSNHQDTRQSGHTPIPTTSAERRAAIYAGVIGGIYYWTHGAGNESETERYARIVDLLDDFATTATGAALLAEPQVTVTEILPAAGGGGR